MARPAGCASSGNYHAGRNSPRLGGTSPERCGPLRCYLAIICYGGPVEFCSVSLSGGWKNITGSFCGDIQRRGVTDSDVRFLGLPPRTPGLRGGSIFPPELYLCFLGSRRYVRMCGRRIFSDKNLRNAAGGTRRFRNGEGWARRNFGFLGTNDLEAKR